MRNNTYNSIDLSYIAGFVDGEGCITIIKTEARREQKTPEYKPYVHIANTDKKVLELIQKEIGGRLNKVTSKQHTKNNQWKQSYCLTWSNQKAFKVCKQLHKYLVTKRKDAEIVMEYYSKQPKRLSPTSKEELLRRDNLIKRLRR